MQYRAEANEATVPACLSVSLPACTPAPMLACPPSLALGLVLGTCGGPMRHILHSDRSWAREGGRGAGGLAVMVVVAALQERSKLRVLVACYPTPATKLSLSP